MSEPILLGPWPLGLDNVHPPRHAVFQLPEKGEPLPRLKVALDVELDDEGWPKTRPLVTSAAVTAGQGIESVAGRLFYQDDGALYEYGNTTALITGLTSRALLTQYGRRVFGSDGSTHFELDKTMVRGWGLPVPVLALSAVAGSTFSAGTYMIQVAFHDGRNEGGCSSPQVITLAATSDISVSVTGHDNRATSIVLYVGTDKQRPSYANTVAISGGGAQVITAIKPTTQGRAPRTEGMTGPWAGITSLAAFRAFLLIGRDNVICRSEGQEPHLFDPSRIIQFKADVTDTAPLSAGFWQGTTHGLYWVAGEDPATWIPQRKTFEPVLRGCAVVPGSSLPFLQVADPVALFLGPTGLLVGLPSGDVVAVTQDRYHVDIDTYSRASFALVKRGELRQLMIAVS